MDDFSVVQLEQIDKIYSAMGDLLALMCGIDNPTMEQIGFLAEDITDILVRSGYRVYFPYEEDGEIHDYYE